MLTLAQSWYLIFGLQCVTMDDYVSCEV